MLRHEQDLLKNICCIPHQPSGKISSRNRVRRWRPGFTVHGSRFHGYSRFLVQDWMHIYIYIMEYMESSSPRIVDGHTTQIFGQWLHVCMASEWRYFTGGEIVISWLIQGFTVEDQTNLEICWTLAQKMMLQHNPWNVKNPWKGRERPWNFMEKICLMFVDFFSICLVSTTCFSLVEKKSDVFLSMAILAF